MCAKHVINNVVNLMVKTNPVKQKLINIRLKGNIAFNFNGFDQQQVGPTMSSTHLTHGKRVIDHSGDPDC